METKDVEIKALKSEIENTKKLCSTSEEKVQLIVQEKSKLEAICMQEREDKALLSTVEKDQRELIVENKYLQLEVDELKKKYEEREKKHKKSERIRRKVGKRDIDDQLQDLESQIAIVGTKNLELTAEIEQKKLQVEKLERDLMTERSEKEQLKVAAESLKGKCGELEAELNENKYELRRLHEEKANLNTKLHNIKIDAKVLKDEKEKLEVSMAAKEDEIRRAQEEFTQSVRVKEKQGALSDIRSMISNHRDMMDVSRSGGRPSSGLPYSMQRPQ